MRVGTPTEGIFAPMQRPKITINCGSLWNENWPAEALIGMQNDAQDF